MKPLERALIPTGLAIALPVGYEAEVRPRSGLAAKFGITVLNAPGTIDADYRGEIKVILINLGDAPFEIKDGDRIAQMVFKETVRVRGRRSNSCPRADGAKGGSVPREGDEPLPGTRCLHDPPQNGTGGIASYHRSI